MGLIVACEGAYGHGKSAVTFKILARTPYNDGAQGKHFVAQSEVLLNNDQHVTHPMSISAFGSHTATAYNIVRSDDDERQSDVNGWTETMVLNPIYNEDVPHPTLDPLAGFIKRDAEVRTNNKQQTTTRLITLLTRH